MPEATIDENGVIECGEFRIMDGAIFQRQFNYWKAILWEDSFDDLYQVLHARHMAQAYDKTYLAKVEQAAKSLKDDPLYKPEGGEENGNH
jgi:Mg2+/Co2+ transporter CorB